MPEWGYPHRGISSTNITGEFKKGNCALVGANFVLGTNKGTYALYAAMFSCGTGQRNKRTCLGITNWADCAVVYTLGATVVFCEIGLY